MLLYTCVPTLNKIYYSYSYAISIGLSDFHKMKVAVMKTTFPKAKPKIVQDRDQKNFVEEDFHIEFW